jgi:hypothetical protein
MSDCRSAHADGDFVPNTDLLQKAANRASTTDATSPMGSAMSLRKISDAGCKRLHPVAEIIILDEFA